MKGWLPIELEQLVIACLAKRPQDRPANARALAESLRAIEIPAEHAWTGARANAWWFVHRPPTSAEPVAATVERLVVGDPTAIDVPVASVATVQHRKSR